MDELERRAAETGRVYCPDCEVALERDGRPGRYTCPRCLATYWTYSTEAGRSR